MTKEYLKIARENGKNMKVDTTEAELIFTNDGVKEAWLEIQRIKQMIAEEQVKAAAEVAARHQTELDEAVTNYALLVSLCR
jgi:hypothetical protein